MKRKTNMKSAPLNLKHARFLSALGAIALSCLLLLSLAPATGAQSRAAVAAKHKTFTTADEAANALIAAADPYDEAALKEILGPDSYDIIHTGEPARDREVSAQFAAKAREKKTVAPDQKNPRHEIISIGDDDWP